jgi:hypothetical protein
MQMARIFPLNDDKNMIAYLEKAMEAARMLERIVSAEEREEALTTLSCFEELVCERLKTSLAAVSKSEPAPISTEASAALWLAADYLEHAADTLERARHLSLDYANRLSKEVPAKLANWRRELNNKTVFKADPVTVSGGSSSWRSLPWSKKKAPAADSSKKQASMLSSEETQKKTEEEALKTVGS